MTNFSEAFNRAEDDMERSRIELIAKLVVIPEKCTVEEAIEGLEKDGVKNAADKLNKAIRKIFEA